MSQKAQILDTLRFLSSQIWHSKLEELKPILIRLPFSNHLFLENSSPTFSEQLITFVRLEKSYHAMQFFCTRSIFSRRENLKASYELLQLWFDRIADSPVEAENIQPKIAMALRNFCLIRTCMIAFYHSIDENPKGILTSCSEFSDSLNKLRNVLTTEDVDGQYAFESIRLSIECELNVLIGLLRAQSYIADLFFGDSLLCLKQASYDLTTLYSCLGFEYSPNARPSGKAFSLLAWLNGFRKTIMAKYTLYWFNILMRSVSNPEDVLTIASTEDPDIVHIVSNFQKVSGALYIAIFFDTTCQEYPFLGHGYVLRGTVGEGPKGVESIPPIFTVPLGQTIPAADIYAIVMQISGVLNLGESVEYDKLVYLFDEKLNHTYFIQKLESRTFLSLVYGGCKSRRDKQIVSFVSSVANLIRLQTLISQLRSR